MKIGFALKIQDKVKQIVVKLVDDMMVHFMRDIPGFTCEFSEAGRTFRASQVAGGCRLNGNGERISPVPHFSSKAGHVITEKKVDQVNKPPGCYLRQEVKAIFKLSRQLIKYYFFLLRLI